VSQRFLGVDGDHRLAGIVMLDDLIVEVGELLINVRMLFANNLIAIGLQAKALFLPQRGDPPRASGRQRHPQ